MAKGNSTFGVLLFYSVTVTIATVVLLADPFAGGRRSRTVQRPVTHLLRSTIAGKLLRCTRVSAPGSTACTQVCFQLSGAPDRVQLSACTVQWDHDNRALAVPESHLALSLDLVPGSWLPRDPGQPLQHGVRLLRLAAGSDLSDDHGAGQSLEISITTDQGRAVISNHSDAPVTALAGGALLAPEVLEELRLPAPGGDPVPALLARVLRARICDNLRVEPSRCYDTGLAIISESEGEGRYLIDLRAPGQGLGVARAQLTLTEAQGGYRGELRALPADSNLGRPAELYLVPPRPPGELLSPHDPGFTAIGWGKGSLRPKTVTVDLGAVLARTRWLSGVAPEVVQ